MKKCWSNKSGAVCEKATEGGTKSRGSTCSTKKKQVIVRLTIVHLNAARKRRVKRDGKHS